MIYNIREILGNFAAKCPKNQQNGHRNHNFSWIFFKIHNFHLLLCTNHYLKSKLKKVQKQKFFFQHLGKSTILCFLNNKQTIDPKNTKFYIFHLWAIPTSPIKFQNYRLKNKKVCSYDIFYHVTMKKS